MDIQYWMDDHWEDMKIVAEEIEVSGQPSAPFRVRTSRFGPVISDASQVQLVALLLIIIIALKFIYKGREY